MAIPGDELGLSGSDLIQVVDLKCDARMIGSFRQEQDIYPGYHMNKANWITVILDGTVKDDRIIFLIDMSYDLTKG